MKVEDIKLSDLTEAFSRLKTKPELVYETPVISVSHQLKQLLPTVRSVSLKLESLNCTGSFKVRGVVHQFLTLSEEDRQKKRMLVTMSAGNYGKAFAYVAKEQELPGVVYMPDHAPLDRKEVIESYGATVSRVPVNELIPSVNAHVQKTNGLFFHSYDDPMLIMGNASAGLELMEQVDEPDVVLVCCGGGGLFAGVATALKLNGWTNTRIYGVEPQNVPKMHCALAAGKLVPFERSPTIAAGLAPPCAGEQAMKLIEKYSDGVLLVSEDDLLKATKVLYNIGLVVEPSGAAAFAALLGNKVPNIDNAKVVVFVTGSNVTSSDLNKHVL